MKAFVTGVGGFVGSHLAARLVDEGWEVVGTVRPASTRTRPVPEAVQAVDADLADPLQAASAARASGADVAFLLAAARAAATPVERAATLAVNATGVRWLLDALPARCRTVVRLGSSTEYGVVDGPMDEAAPVCPRGFFGATKAAGSSLLLAAGDAWRIAVLRAFQIYGPFDHPGRLVPTVLRAARTGQTVALTAPGRRRDWVFVDDVVDACVRAAVADRLPPAQVLNIGTGRQVTNEEVVATVEQVTGRPVAVAAGAYPGRAWDTASWVCDPTRARELLGWEAKVALDDGLRRCWA